MEGGEGDGDAGAAGVHHLLMPSPGGRHAQRHARRGAKPKTAENKDVTTTDADAGMQLDVWMWMSCLRMRVDVETTGGCKDVPPLWACMHACMHAWPPCHHMEAVMTARCCPACMFGELLPPVGARGAPAGEKP